MRPIFSKSKKEAARLAIDTFNKANIFDVKIPDLKVHNRVLTKKEGPIEKVWLTRKDLDEYQINPKKVSNRLRKKEEGYVYEQQISTFDADVNFMDELKLYGDAKEVAQTIKDYIIDKFNLLENDVYHYKIHSVGEKGCQIVEKNYDSGGNILSTYPGRAISHSIYMYYQVSKFEKITRKEYYEIKKIIYINVKETDCKEMKIHLNVTLQNYLDIVINVEI